MMQFEHSSWIAAPVEDVFAFHHRPDALQLLTPPGQPIEIVERTGSLEVGACVVLRVKLGPFRVTWVAHHIAYEPNRLFIDEQREGPFAAWVHAHQFASENGGTRLTDSIEFALPGGLVAERFAGWLVIRKLKAMFEYRHAVTKRMCEAARG
jgi:ligand-binding SRPBCC domain-containing protein